MKRDLNLVRMILLDIESSPPGQPISGFTYDGRSKAEILEHVELLLDANFIDGQMIPGNMGQPEGCMVMRMTWDGQEFLAKAKNDTVWKKVFAQAEEKGMSASLVVINGLLEAAAKKYVGLEK
jgi:hypothetical protein